MLRWIASFLLLVNHLSSAAPFSSENGSSTSTHLYLPQNDPNLAQRNVEIETNRQGYIYAPSLLGNMSFFVGGDLGAIKVQSEIAAWFDEEEELGIDATEELTAAMSAVTQGGNLSSLAKYELLYDGQWKQTNPDGVAPGTLTNYTEDLFFSMERLSSNAFTIRRLNPANDSLPFPLDDEIVGKIANGKTLEELFKSGRLFLSDHSYMASPEYQQFLISNRYAAACTAYFFMHPQTDDLLPLAIKTNVGSDLIYTPLDSPNDWLLAKIMFNTNDLFHGQVYHLAASHAVAEIVYLAALRTMSSRHPVFALLDRLMYRALAIRPIGSEILFNPGGLFDTIFAFSHGAAEQLSTQLYSTSAGNFQANYLGTNLRNRGLLDCQYGPQLKSLPIWTEITALMTPINEYITSYVKAFYPTEGSLTNDTELSAWLTEATGPAEVLDFPSAIPSRSSLIEVLEHMAYLASLNHHVLNQGAPFATGGVLPFHPAALYHPVPTSKNISDIMPWLPALNESLAQVQLLALFNRNEQTVKNESLVEMFSDPLLEQNVNATGFRDQMTQLDTTIKARGFDSNGLSLGMPFVWSVLAPKRIPFFLSV